MFRPAPFSASARLAGWCLLGGAVLSSAGCFAVRPGYADSATGRVYAGFAKPAFYPSDLLLYRDCDGCRPPYVPPVAAFCPWGCAKYANGCRPPLATTEVYAPPIARYEDYPGNPGLRPGTGDPDPNFDRDGGRDGRLRGAPPAPAPAPAPIPLDSSRDDLGDDPFGSEREYDIDADAASPALPSLNSLETEPDGVGE